MARCMVQVPYGCNQELQPSGLADSNQLFIEKRSALHDPYHETIITPHPSLLILHFPSMILHFSSSSPPALRPFFITPLDDPSPPDCVPSPAFDLPHSMPSVTLLRLPSQGLRPFSSQMSKNIASLGAVSCTLQLTARSRSVLCNFVFHATRAS